MRTPVMTPVGAVVRGLAAGAAGTTAMDLLLFARYRHGSGEAGFRAWELSEGIESWDQAPAPAHVGRRLIEGLFQRELPDRLAPLVNNVTHWGYGVVNGALYGLIAGSVRAPRIRSGLPFGAGVWGPATSSCPPPSSTSRSGSTTDGRSRTTWAHTWSTGSRRP